MRSDSTERSYRSTPRSPRRGHRKPRSVIRWSRGRQAHAASMEQSEHSASGERHPRQLLRLGDGRGRSEGQPGSPDSSAEEAADAVYRLTRDEVVAMLLATETGASGGRSTSGSAVGLRNAELRGLHGRHFQRAGFVWVSADIAKGGRERWVPVIGRPRGGRRRDPGRRGAGRVRAPRPCGCAIRRSTDAGSNGRAQVVQSGAKDSRNGDRHPRRHQGAHLSAPHAPRIRRSHRPPRGDAQRAVPARSRGHRDDRDLCRAADFGGPCRGGRGLRLRAAAANGCSRGTARGRKAREASTGIEPVYTALQAVA